MSPENTKRNRISFELVKIREGIKLLTIRSSPVPQQVYSWFDYLLYRYMIIGLKKNYDN